MTRIHKHILLIYTCSQDAVLPLVLLLTWTSIQADPAGGHYPPRVSMGSLPFPMRTYLVFINWHTLLPPPTLSVSDCLFRQVPVKLLEYPPRGNLQSKLIPQDRGQADTRPPSPSLLTCREKSLILFFFSILGCFMLIGVGGIWMRPIQEIRCLEPTSDVTSSALRVLALLELM